MSIYGTFIHTFQIFVQNSEVHFHRWHLHEIGKWSYSKFGTKKLLTWNCIIFYIWLDVQVSGWEWAPLILLRERQSKEILVGFPVTSFTLWMVTFLPLPMGPKIALLIEIYDVCVLKKNQGGLRCLSSNLAFPFTQPFRNFCLKTGIPIAFLWPKAWVTHWNSKLGMLRHPPKKKCLLWK